MIVKKLYRYPVKGLSAEPIETVALRTGYGFPFDRKFALALPSTAFDKDNPKPAPKHRFLMLMKHEQLSSLSTKYDEQSDSFIITDRDGKILIDTTLSSKDGVDEIEGFFYHLLQDVLDDRPRLVQADGHQFTDVSVLSKDMMHAISLINLASVRSFENTIDRPVHPLRFRANIYFDSDTPWCEFDLLGKTIKIGDVPLEIVQRTRRCPATQVNPETAKRDINVPALLQENLDHADMGVYAEIKSAGEIKVGDSLVI